MKVVPYGINVFISGLLLAKEVFIKPFYHPSDAVGLFLEHLLGTTLYTFLNNLLT